MRIRHLATLFLISCAAFAQTSDTQSDDKEPAAIVELGGADSWELAGGSSNGADAAVEFTPIEDWLEIEIGTTPLFAHHTTEWDTDVLFKKPWTLSKKAEIMAGFGPEWVHTRQFGVTKNSIAGELALDFMYWPGGQHRFGLFVEPAYDYIFGHPHEPSMSLSWGLLIGIR